MDRFRFRAWHKERKQMYDVNLLQWDIATGKLEHIWLTDTPNSHHAFPDEIELMQCVGLSDSTGKSLLFEGDIIDAKGRKVGNYYENGEVFKGRTNHIIKGMGTKEWESSYAEAIKRGCRYA